MNIDQNLPKFLANRLKEQYGQEIFEKILRGYLANRKTTFRVNTIKTDTNTIQNNLKQLGIEYEKVSWSSEALILKDAQEKDIQSLEMYEKGEIYLQSLSSMLPQMVTRRIPRLCCSTVRGFVLCPDGIVYLF